MLGQHPNDEPAVRTEMRHAEHRTKKRVLLGVHSQLRGSRQNFRKMSLNSKRVTQASAVCGTFTKAQRQFLAANFEHAKRDHAKSVQCSLSPKGVLRTSIYFEFPPPTQQTDGSDADNVDDVHNVVANSARAVTLPTTVPASATASALLQEVRSAAAYV